MRCSLWTVVGSSTLRTSSPLGSPPGEVHANIRRSIIISAAPAPPASRYDWKAGEYHRGTSILIQCHVIFCLLHWPVQRYTHRGQFVVTGAGTVSRPESTHGHAPVAPQ